MRKRALGSGQCAVSHALRANDQFKRFKPEPTHEVRELEVTGTELERLRARRQMLRDMTPEQVLQVIEFYRDLNFFEALALAKREGKLIVPNDVLHTILKQKRDEKYLQQVCRLGVRTGTLIVYEKQDQPFGEQVVANWKHGEFYYSISFTVPERFRGKVDCILLVNYPDFEIFRVLRTWRSFPKKPNASDPWAQDFKLINVGINRFNLEVADENNIRLIEKSPRTADTGQLWGGQYGAGIIPVSRDYYDFAFRSELEHHDWYYGGGVIAVY